MITNPADVLATTLFQALPGPLPERKCLPPRYRVRETKSEQLRRAARTALEYSNTIRWHDGDRLVNQPTDAFMEVYSATDIEKIMSRLVRTAKPVMRKVRMFGGRERLQLTDLGRGFLDLFGPCGEIYSVLDEFPSHAFHPLIDLFFTHAKSLLLRMPFRLSRDAEAINECVANIRREASSGSFQRRRSKHIKLVRKNTESLLDYINALFERWSRLLVIRLDLNYKRGMERSADDIGYGQVRAHREQFQGYLRSSKCPAVLRGYAWSLEMGRSSSFHYHMLLFFDGHQSRQDVALAKVLGEHWNNVVTHKQGRYYNCNADKHSKRGVGLIDYRNADALKSLKEVVAPYLTKADYYIRTMVEDGRTFSHGRVPAAPVRSGRPRESLLERESV